MFPRVDSYSQTRGFHYKRVTVDDNILPFTQCESFELEYLATVCISLYCTTTLESNEFLCLPSILIGFLADE